MLKAEGTKRKVEILQLEAFQELAQKVLFGTGQDIGHPKKA